MSDTKVHKCPAQSPAVQVCYSRPYAFPRPTWHLAILREATEADLAQNPELRRVGEPIWVTSVEINYCPYCGTRLREDESGLP